MDLHGKKNGPHRVVVFTSYPWSHALTVLRISGPLKEAGIEIIRGDNDPERVRLGEAVLIQRDFPRQIGSYATIVANARAEGKPLIYEIDDLLFELPEEHPYTSVGYFRPAFLPMLHAVLEADLITTPSEPLRRFLLPFNPNTWVLHNYLNDRIWHPREAIENPEPRVVLVGFMGSDSHLPDLEWIAPVLLKLLERYRETIGMRFWVRELPSDIRKYPNVEWIHLAIPSYSDFAEYFSQQQCDLFIAPLIQGPFNECKSQIKFLEYSWLGIPGVYSRLAPYESVVEHGRNGFLASTPEEWEDCLSRLIEGPSLRAEMGMRAKQTVKDQWLLSQHAHEWPELYGQAIIPPRSLQRSQATWADQGTAAALSILSKALNWQETVQADRERALADRERALADLDDTRRALAKEKEASRLLSERLNDITTSDAWKIVTRLWAIRLALAPHGSHREALAQSLMEFLRNRKPGK
jgi:processive 1,2-diacylglycerol beta-glucosyltransferase